jgi:hypothetical protein
MWPDSAVSSIRRARQLSGDKLPSLGRHTTAEDDPKPAIRQQLRLQILDLQLCGPTKALERLRRTFQTASPGPRSDPTQKSGLSARGTARSFPA